MSLEQCLDRNKILLAVKEPAHTAVSPVQRTLEARALPPQPRLLEEPSFLQDHRHPFEYTRTRVAFWEVEWLRLTIWEGSGRHLNLLLEFCSICGINVSALVVKLWCFNEPVLPRFWCIADHVTCREGIWGLLEVCASIIIDEDVPIIGKVFFEDIHRVSGLIKDFFIC